jgi:hypothetical protein
VAKKTIKERTKTIKPQTAHLMTKIMDYAKVKSKSELLNKEAIYKIYVQNQIISKLQNDHKEIKKIIYFYTKINLKLRNRITELKNELDKKTNNDLKYQQKIDKLEKSLKKIRKITRQKIIDAINRQKFTSQTMPSFVLSNTTKIKDTKLKDINLKQPKIKDIKLHK